MEVGQFGLVMLNMFTLQKLCNELPIDFQVGHHLLKLDRHPERLRDDAVKR